MKILIAIICIIVVLVILAVLMFRRSETRSESISLQVRPSELLSALRKVEFVSRRATAPPVLCGIGFMIEEKSIMLMASDCKQCVLQPINIHGKTGPNGFNIVAQNDVSRLISSLKGLSDLVTISVSNDGCFSIETQEHLRFKSIDGTYPNLLDLVSDYWDSPITVTVKRNELLGLLEKIQPADGIPVSLHLTSRTMQIGEQKMETDYEGTEITLSMNSGFLRDALAAQESATVKFHFYKPERPIMLSGDQGWCYLVMPMVQSQSTFVDDAPKTAPEK